MIHLQKLSISLKILLPLLHIPGIVTCSVIHTGNYNHSLHLIAIEKELGYICVLYI